MNSLLTVDAAAALLNISRRKLCYLYTRGDIPYFRCDRVIRFEEEDVRNFVARHKISVQPEPVVVDQ